MSNDLADIYSKIDVCVGDPMHGNTRSSPESGVKTRQFSSIISELSSALSVHKLNGSHLGGVHLELTGVRR